MTPCGSRAFHRMGNDSRYRLQPIPAIVDFGNRFVIVLDRRRLTSLREVPVGSFPRRGGGERSTPDGSLFVVGSPLKLTLYHLP